MKTPRTPKQGPVREAQLIPLDPPKRPRTDLLHAIKTVFFADCPDKFVVKIRRYQEIPR